MRDRHTEEHGRRHQVAGDHERSPSHPVHPGAGRQADHQPGDPQQRRQKSDLERARVQGEHRDQRQCGGGERVAESARGLPDPQKPEVPLGEQTPPPATSSAVVQPRRCGWQCRFVALDHDWKVLLAGAGRAVRDAGQRRARRRTRSPAPARCAAPLTCIAGRGRRAARPSRPSRPSEEQVRAAAVLAWPPLCAVIRSRCDTSPRAVAIRSPYSSRIDRRTHRGGSVALARHHSSCISVTRIRSGATYRQTWDGACVSLSTVWSQGQGGPGVG